MSNDTCCVRRTIKAQMPFTRSAGFSLWVNPQRSSTAPDSKMGYDWKGEKCQSHGYKQNVEPACDSPTLIPSYFHRAGIKQPVNSWEEPEQDSPTNLNLPTDSDSGFSFTFLTLQRCLWICTFSTMWLHDLVQRLLSLHWGAVTPCLAHAYEWVWGSASSMAG